MIFRVLSRQLGSHFVEATFEGEADTEAELFVRSRGVASECGRVRLPAKRRVRLTRSNRLRQLPFHRDGISLDEGKEIREPAGPVEIELPLRSLTQNAPCFVIAIEGEQRGRQVAVGGGELRVQADRLAERSDRVLEVTEADLRDAQAVERTGFAGIGCRPGARQIERLVPGLRGVAVIAP